MSEITRYTPAGLNEQQTAALLHNQTVQVGHTAHYLAGDNRNANYPNGRIDGISWDTGTTPGYCSMREARDLSCPVGGEPLEVTREHWRTQPDPMAQAHSMAGGAVWAFGLLLLVMVIAALFSLAA